MTVAFSHYSVVRRLGAGGMGEVFLAQDTKLERSVALKVMSAELARDENQRKRFRMEAKAASGLVHPNVCVVHEVGESEDGRPYLAMEYIEGQTLDAVARERRVRLREVVRIGEGVAEALDAAHSRGIVHRDIKPGNIMLDSRGQVKVLDFGLAKRASGRGADLTSTSVVQTRSGMLIGTPTYMSPEQVLGRPLDARSDIFSLGAVLYELITGQRPFIGKTVGETINAVVNQQPEPLGLENPLYSPALDHIVFKCLAKDPEQRYGNARELARDLADLREATERATQSGSISGTVPRTRVTERGQLWRAASQATQMGRSGWFVAGAGVLALVVLAPLYLSNRDLRDVDGSAAKQNSAAAAARPRQSIAVLPFDNYSAEPDSDYLSDGLTEEITTALSRIPGLKVAARNSAFTFKGRREDARKVGETLNVNTVLEGSVRRNGNQVRVTAQLINASNGYHLWSETFNATVEDVFKLQEEIARRIAEKLQGTNTASAVQMAARRDADAHKLYLQARLSWNKRSEPGLRKAVELFRAAIEKDPTYAAAHAGLAATYLVFPLYAPGSTRDTYHPLAKASAQRALELDSGCADAHAVLGQLDSGWGDHVSAEQHFRRAIELNPNFATAHHWYGLHLMMNGRRSEALKEFETAVDLDPLSPVVHTILAQWYYFGRDYDRAEKEMRNVTAAFSDFLVARHSLVQILLKKEAYQEALEELDRIAELDKSNPLAGIDMRGYALARMGRKDEALGILRRIQEAQAAGKPFEGGDFWIYLGLREYDKAVTVLEQSASLKGLGRELLEDPFLEELLEVPAFKSFLVRSGLVKPEPKRELRSASSG